MRRPHLLRRLTLLPATLVLVAACAPIAAPPVAGPPPEAVAPIDTYRLARRCDTGPPSSTLPEASKVHLIGNSILVELVSCLTEILRRNGAGVEPTANAGAALCDLIEPAEAKLAAHPDISVAVIFAFRGGATDYRPCLGGDLPTRRPGDGSVERFVADTKALVDLHVNAGKKVLLVPPPVDGGGTGEDPVAPAYRKLAQDYESGTVKVGEVGRFLKSGNTWTKFAKCLPNEAGCLADGRVQIRRGPPDKWRHFCTSPGVQFNAEACPPQYAAGERRGASSVAEGLLKPKMIP